MPRKKRSELAREIAKTKEKEERQEAKIGKEVEREIIHEVREAICPVCGRCFHLQHRAGLQDYLDSFDPDKPFGVILDNQGGKRHGYRFIGYFNPEEDTNGIFEAVKDRFLQALKEWTAKGWITKQEIEKIFK